MVASCTVTSAHFTDFQEFLTGYPSVAQGNFFGIICSSWDAPSAGIPIDAWMVLNHPAYTIITEYICIIIMGLVLLCPPHQFIFV